MDTAREQVVGTKAELGLGGWALVVTRILCGVMAALVLFQGALAGSFLGGEGGALAIHEMMGTEVLTIVALVTMIAALMGVRRKWWVFPLTLLGGAGITYQIIAGFNDQLQVHVPLGIALFGLYLALALTIRNYTKKEKV